MKISDFEKYIVNNELNEEEFIKFIDTTKEKLEFDYNSFRKLTDEEIDYEYFDEYAVQFIEGFDYPNEESHNDHQNCTCSCNHEGTHHYSHHKEDEEDKEKRFYSNIRFSHILALYLLREGIHYVDLVQEGLVGLVKVNNLFENKEQFEKAKLYFIAKEMIEYIKKYSFYRETSFKQYIETEKEKEVQLKLSPKVRLKNRDDEIKKADLERKEEHKKEIARLEGLTKNMFSYFNLKYRLSIREIEVLSLYFGFDGRGKKNFSDIQNIMNLGSTELDKILKESIFKLSVVDERIEI